MARKLIPARLRLSKAVCEQLLAAAKDQRRSPTQILNLLLEWALQQQALLQFDLSTLLKVNLSVSDLPQGNLTEPWNHVISGEWQESGDGTLQRLVVK